MCPGGHLEGFEACLQRRPALRTRARNSFVFQRKIKDLHENLLNKIGFQKKIKDLNDHLKKVIGFSNGNQRFQR